MFEVIDLRWVSYQSQTLFNLSCHCYLGFIVRKVNRYFTPIKYSIIYVLFSPPSILQTQNLTAFYANLENFSHAQRPIMNTANKSLQPNPAHSPINGLFLALKKIAAVSIALIGIGFIL